MKPIHLLSAAVLVGLILTGCNTSNDEVVNDDDPVTPIMRHDISLSAGAKEVVARHVDFSLRLFNQMADNVEGNFNISPLSLSAVLSALADGAAGTTAAELNSVLGQEDCSSGDVESCYAKILSELPELDNTVAMAVANSMWINSGFEVLSSYQSLVEKRYGMELYELDFGQSNAVGNINNWCSEHTDGRIKSVLNNINSTCRLFLLNAIYFNGKWREQFDTADTKTETFCGATSESRVSMMHRYDEIIYARTNRFAMVDLPYGNRAFSMAVLLPEVDGTAPTAADWAELKDSIWPVSPIVDLSLPKFMFENTFDLIAPMKVMGLQTAFDSTAADFSKMAIEPLYLSLLMQKTFITVDESGTEAAAVTIGGMDVTSVGPSAQPQVVVFRADRPFYFIIHEYSTGAILFIGRVSDL